MPSEDRKSITCLKIAVFRFVLLLKAGHKGFCLSFRSAFLPLFRGLSRTVGFVRLCDFAAFLEGLASYAQQVDLYCSLAASVIYTPVKRISKHLLKYLIAVMFFVCLFFCWFLLYHVRLDFFALSSFDMIPKCL